MVNEYVEAYRLFAKVANVTPDEDACIFSVSAEENGIIRIVPGKPARR
jgi:hypothetical protein